MHVLVLGGTTEGRVLADRLHAAGVAVTSSLAGRVAAPATPAGAVRVGGFGGPDGLAAFVREAGVSVVIDATHPFAARMHANAATACATAGVALLRLQRPAWAARPGDDWHPVADLATAAAAVPRLGRRVLLTTGRLDVAAFAAVDEAWFVIRSIGRPDGPLPPRHELLLERGPFTLPGELELLRSRRIDLLVTKNSGGEATAAKLAAARELQVPVLIVQRPWAPPAPTLATVDAVLERLLAGGPSRPVA